MTSTKTLTTKDYRNIAEHLMAVWVKSQGSAAGESFSHNLVNFHVDFQKFASMILGARDFEVLCSVHIDQLSHIDACALHGVRTERPDRYVSRREVLLGREFVRNMDMFDALDLTA